MIITNTLTGEVIEIHVPQEYKKESMIVNLVLDKKFRVKQKSAEADSEIMVETVEKNFNS